MAWLISLALILSSLVIPMIIVLLFSGCKRAHKNRVEEKLVAEDLSQFDHIYDPDGIYRTSKFDGMLGEDAADDVEIPSQLNKSDKSGKGNALPPQKKHASTQTDPLFAYGSERKAMYEKYIPIFEKYDLQRTMECPEEAEHARPSRRPRQITPQKLTPRGTLRYRGKTERKRQNAKGNKDDAAKRAKGALTPVEDHTVYTKEDERNHDPRPGAGK
ncbi:hypothetical protein Y032_0031g2278 [Ancylostoma ceylanicum]|uniref:Uncharacterized protein n=2 Tax=Ancylostoma ceylanicum TaxID=53326 RepID=A0A016URJ4_9BILA|nr:hypothetical protein Y032_0031g2278 [Ancylostoma ceylanicum]